MTKYIANVTLVRHRSGDQWKPKPQSSQETILTKGETYTQEQVDTMYPWYVSSGYLTAV